MVGQFHEQAEALANKYGGYWSEHPDYPLSNWIQEVRDGDTRLGYWPWVLSKLSDEHVHLVVQNPGDVAIVFTRELLADLTALLDYCQDDSERQDFSFHVSENYDAGLSESELETLVTGDDDEIQAILEKAAAKPDATHIWAIAHRIRRLLPE